MKLYQRAPTEPRVRFNEFKEIFNLTEYTARNLVRIRTFPSIKLGSRYYIDVDRAVEWFKKNEEKGVKFQ